MGLIRKAEGGSLAPNKKGRLGDDHDVETQKKQPNPRRCVDERKLASTFFFDAEASCEFGFQTCLRAMLKQAGLGGLFEKSAPTYASWTTSFLCSLDEAVKEEESEPLEATTTAIQKGSPAGAGSLARVCAQLDRIEEQLAQDRKVWREQFADFERRIEKLLPTAPPLLPHHE